MRSGPKTDPVSMPSGVGCRSRSVRAQHRRSQIMSDVNSFTLQKDKEECLELVAATDHDGSRDTVWHALQTDPNRDDWTGWQPFGNPGHGAAMGRAGPRPGKGTPKAAWRSSSRAGTSRCGAAGRPKRPPTADRIGLRSEPPAGPACWLRRPSGRTMTDALRSSSCARTGRCGTAGSAPRASRVPGRAGTRLARRAARCSPPRSPSPATSSAVWRHLRRWRL